MTTSSSSNIGHNGNKADYFIANRLRGIPLVSAARQAARPPSGSAGSQPATSGTQVAPTARLRPSQVGKRDAAAMALAEAHTNRIGSQAEILFKQSASTASMANLLRPAAAASAGQLGASSTRRPASSTARYRPTVRHKVTPRPAASTSTGRPAPRRPSGANGKLAKMLGRGQPPATSAAPKPQVAATASPTSTSTNATSSTAPGATGHSWPAQVEPISSVKMSTLQAMSSNVEYELSDNGGQRPPTSPAAAPSTPAGQRTSLSKAIQTLTTQPVSQRRTQQNVVQSRAFSSSSNPRYSGVSSPLGADPKFAGENWRLFNRTDGSFSPFELLVLVSNVLIVSTVLVVILFNWIKMFRKRRRMSQVQQQQQQRQQQQPQQHLRLTHEQQSGAAPNQMAHDERISQISSGLSGFTSTTANETGTTLTASGHSRPPDLGPQPQGEPRGLKPVGQLQGTSGSASVQVINKAMAIVQPTENVANSQQQQQQLGGPLEGANEKTKLLRDELGKGSRAISRSVSDLSGSTGGVGPLSKSAATKKSADDLASMGARTLSTPERVSALEQLFRRESAARGGGGGGVKRRNGSRGSLESIELPANLVEPLKRQAAGAPLAPSPNLLLGQVAAPSEHKAKSPPPPPQQQQQLQPQPQQPPAAKVTTEAAKAGEPEEKAASIGRQSADLRPENPMSREMAKEEAVAATAAAAASDRSDKDKKRPAVSRNEVTEPSPPPPPKEQVDAARAPAAEIKNHQVVVNKLDKLKTNLEIVDLRDASVTGNMRQPATAGHAAISPSSTAGWISMDGVAVVQTAPAQVLQPASPVAGAAGAAGTAGVPLSPSELIESRFRVDYRNRRASAATAAAAHSDSLDSKQEEYAFNNIEHELEHDNRIGSRKYFVYIVHDGHFTAKKECIARIELPPKRRITLAELRQLIANSQDISLSSLRRNRFKFVTETYRLLNENEDAAVLHQVYPTQGVFLKLNVAEGEGHQAYAFKGPRSGRLSTGSLAQATIASRRRATTRKLPAIEINEASQRAASAAGAYRRSKSSLQTTGGRARAPAAGGMRRGASNSQLAAGRRNNNNTGSGLPSLGMSAGGHYPADRPHERHYLPTDLGGAAQQGARAAGKSLLETAATDLGANMLSGAKKLFSATFHR